MKNYIIAAGIGAIGYFVVKPHLSSEREIIEEMPLPTEEELMRYT